MKRTELICGAVEGELPLPIEDVLKRWLADTNDQGRQLEPPELAARKGVTKPNSNPNAGYAPEAAKPAAKP